MRKRRIFLYIFIVVLVLSNAVTFYVARVSGNPFNELSLPVPKVQEETADAPDDFEKEMKVFYEVYRILKKGYIRPLSPEELVEGAIRGMIETLDDPHTAFLDQEYMEDMLIHTTGSFSGVGLCIVERGEEIVITEVMKDTPAYKAGLRTGDIITRVDGRELKSLCVDEAARLLRGPKGTSVVIEVKRDGKETLEFEVIRDDIEVQTVFAEIIGNDKVGYINITNFDQHTGKDFLESLSRLEREGINGLVLDLRYNPGGLFDEAIIVGKEIVPKGEITRVVDREGKVIDAYYSHSAGKPYPIVVLVNEYTASAAEIIAGALQDSGAAVLVGQPTYGKATVQHLEFLSGGGGLRYTMAKYLTPSGRDLHQKGLEPDYRVEQGEAYLLSKYSFPAEVSEGDYGEDVLLLQRMLKALGFTIKITGIFDDNTVESLTEFQRRVSLNPTGYLDKATQKALQDALLEEAERSDKQLNFALSLITGK